MKRVNNNDMKTAKEYWLSKFPEAEKDWGKTGHDDNFQIRMMEEYGKYYHEILNTK